MRNIRLVLEYDGTRFFGFQKQKRARTIQREIQKALFRILRERVSVIPASRTDSGVHARGQIVNFKTRSGIPLPNIRRALNSYLPEDLAVRKISLAPGNFHARYHAKRKRYCYRLLTGSDRRPLERFYAAHCSFPLDVPLMQKAARRLVGRKDFRSFQAHSEGEKSTVRTLYRSEVRKKGQFLHFVFEGDGFLYNMVRNIVGTLLLVGRGKISLADFDRILEARDRRQAGPTAPPQGLVLEKVSYA
ncbi:MAG: tRNA pseudouridine(38-40) synthase TruA [Candidatus Omnitrophica bacterium]|nr:tRNA pseudouridine(38-40) synthase TruA [Candidatus Omnitrophota bacterium]